VFKTLLYLIILFPVSCYAQFTITGRVLKQADKKPVADASVFLNNATIGSQTANDGTYTLHNINPGKYDLVVSIVGFETYNVSITVANENIKLPDIMLFIKTIALKEVQIKFREDPDREKYLGWFRDEFLGTSVIAGECQIKNPEVLDFTYDDQTGTLKASSNSFIKITNEELGYNIKYLLSDFTLSNRNTQFKKIYYKGAVLYEEMKGTPSNETNWQKARHDVYENSSLHFFRAAANNQMYKEGFRVFRLANFVNPDRPSDSLIAAKVKLFQATKAGRNSDRDSLGYWAKKQKLPSTLQKLMPYQLKAEDIITTTDKPALFKLGCDNDALYITYNKNHHFKKHERLSDLDDPSNAENTLISFHEPSAYFYSNGVVINPYSVLYQGVWGRRRVAELLPIDYELPQGDKIPENNMVSNNIVAKLDSFNKSQIIEKPYLIFNKPYYAINDTIWFNAYLFNSHLMPSDKSKILNVDVANDSNKIIREYRLPLDSGVTQGDISLDEKEFSSGTYTVRAYTNWMRNFDACYFYYKTFFITGAGEQNWLVNQQAKGAEIDGNYHENLKLQFSDINNKHFALEPIMLNVTAGKKSLFKQTLNTGIDGSIALNFPVPPKTTTVTIIAENEKNNKRAIIPVALNKPEDIDLQFLPEGGNLIVGLPAHVGFKAIGDDGKGVNIRGTILNKATKQIAEFESLHNGMGSFDMVIDTGETYTATVTLPNGAIKEYPLPVVKPSGTILQIKNQLKSDSIDVSIAATNDLTQSADKFLLIGEARGIICYAAIFDFQGHNAIRKKIAKSLFPTGIAHFSILTTKYRPLNERQTFIDHDDQINIKLNTNKQNYSPRDSVAINIEVSDKTGEPLQGNFSLAVNDNSLVKNDSLNNDNILVRMLLSADLKGFIEKPSYFFSKTPGAWLALDNLLLTQGWIGFNKEPDLSPPHIVYPAETSYRVKGYVTNASNKPLKGTDVLLFSKSPTIIMDTVTDNEGKFAFNIVPKVDTPLFVLKAVNKSGASFNVRIFPEETVPPDFKKPVDTLAKPWYLSGDSTWIKYINRSALITQQQNMLPGGHLLREVKIKGQKIVLDSQNKFGVPDVVLDEKDLEKQGEKSFLQLLEENVKGFHASDVVVFTHSISGNIVYHWYLINQKPVIISVDGIFLHQVIQPIDFLTLKLYLESHNASDIKGLEVMTKANERFAFIEITTRSGKGPNIDNTPGTCIYKPLPLTWPKQFYKPRYTLSDTSHYFPGLRSTIDWEPNITTDGNGRATVHFYAGDKPSTYTVTIEGTDMNGNFGYKTAKIRIDKFINKNE
jgi:hypothetical protein